MGLLWVDYGEEFQNLVDRSWEIQTGDEKAYFDRLPDRVKKIIYRDTRYNVDFLYTAYELGEDGVMENYARWLYRLMEGVVSKKWANYPMEHYVIRHFEYMKKAVSEAAGKDKKAELTRLLTLAQEAVKDEASSEEAPDRPSIYEPEVEAYLQALLDHDMRRCLFLVDRFMERKIPVDSVYVDILAEAMRRGGESSGITGRFPWRRNIIARPSPRWPCPACTPPSLPFPGRRNLFSVPARQGSSMTWGSAWVSVKFSSVIHLTVDDYYLRGFGFISISV